ncbi:hypothetical protein [Streptomyces sp. Ncost-T10-10d]|uniref:hypothetical protein n=1 Tax=Streptomyces sp. Ncost-T10-10d TaxID=1839774 RepID=UPI00081F4B69|nr:hypothetical protein [Streptomyces sp. Ncost-T10-10d]SCF90819.1 hypothetical protein GA0115254_124225 [Streptomyces sp. Ncost-T10-10d]
MVTRSTVVTAALAGAMALTATGSTFTSAATIESARPAPAVPAAPAAPVVRQAAAPASAPNGEGDAGKGDQGRGYDEGRGNNEGGGNDEGRDNGEGRGNDEGRGNNEGRGDEGRGHGGGRGYDEGRIHFNERTYSAYPGGCVTAASGLGATSFNIFNESRRTVEVFSGATCDNGGPVAVVGPYGATSGVFPQRVDGGVFINDGVGASFRVIGYDFEGE